MKVNKIISTWNGVRADWNNFTSTDAGSIPLAHSRIYSLQCLDPYFKENLMYFHLHFQLECQWIDIDIKIFEYENTFKANCVPIKQ